MLAAENSAVDLNAHGPERAYRLGSLLNARVRPTNLGQLAAMSWLVERLTQNDLLDAFGERILPLDFDAVLQDTKTALRKVLAHLNIPAAPERVAAIAAGDVLARYSKAPDQDYSPKLRAARLADARRLYGDEIRMALSWLDQLGKAHDRVAAIL
jgi:hypothetical protein